jgi:oxalate decarboxylase
VENTGSGPLRFLEMFKSAHYADVSLNQWLALTPPELVEASLNIDAKTVKALRKTKAPVVPV